MVTTSEQQGTVLDMTAKAATQPQSQTHPEDDDVLSSIRAIKEIVEKEFSLSEHNRRRLSISSVDEGAVVNENENDNNAAPDAPANATNNNIEDYNSWKNQCYRLKQELYEIKNKNKFEFQQKINELQSIKKHLTDSELELKCELDMKTILQDTVTSQNIHSQTLTNQLNISKENQKLLQTKLSNLVTSLDNEKTSIESERLTSRQLVEEKQFFIDDIQKRCDLEEIKTLRLDNECTTMKLKIQQQTIIIQKQMEEAEKIKTLHIESMQRMQDLLEQSTAATATVTAASTSATATAIVDDFKTDLVVKALKVQVKRLTESNTKLLDEKDEAAANAAANATANATGTTGAGTSQIVFELESSKKQMIIIQELKKIIQQKKSAYEKLLVDYENEKEMNNANNNGMTTAAITPIDTSAEPTTTSLQKKLHALEAGLVKDSNTIKSLENQISSTEKQSQKTKGSSNVVVVLRKKKHLLDGMKKQYRTKSILVSNDIINLQLKRLVEIQRRGTNVGNIQQLNEWNVAIKKLSENHSRIITLRNSLQEQEKEDNNKESSSSSSSSTNNNNGGSINDGATTAAATAAFTATTTAADAGATGGGKFCYGNDENVRKRVDYKMKDGWMDGWMDG
ncbi:hypothetical protein FRACYDRAFT_254157 [Fragilariopsis cylindrus CCMP1102]|uniref:Uncharacterized protein n=1 Tax=Fragilariopsis cylindrus CCMP1102 TaxID=635003 RepID=A0A1E7EL30_9STRA|nr:hypothetical protein FRACYDRAFT_254157 [Fragilariopsis cylindrus CCMP1102]|eukprot:OEU06608.1 hypothetical protein FRACYDRAFT_254157 [Fragilariopsis cylindrus CCMP1102]